MKSRMEELLESLSAGVVAEQNALREFAADFAKAHGEGNLHDMVAALKGTLTMAALLLHDYRESRGMEDILTDMGKLRGRLEQAEAENGGNGNRRAQRS